ncbi:hypothetical protein AKJ37_07995 [candidate division MSBL1 archaeon SCGC-AAA259I09]|uniref:Uncharacterized protein n=1 Tax=candidate division MSBL1 archaeon SCGC-AAA259I09 TaxID=1698267 RepID=A0A133UIR5_9EURY|nr:hypothetical protein AKJ37_07995 [candidate division MSBL1 archaeon SCGC-AAA259I09]
MFGFRHIFFPCVLGKFLMALILVYVGETAGWIVGQSWISALRGRTEPKVALEGSEQYQFRQTGTVGKKLNTLPVTLQKIEGSVRILCHSVKGEKRREIREKAKRGRPMVNGLTLIVSPRFS